MTKKEFLCAAEGLARRCNWLIKSRICDSEEIRVYPVNTKNVVVMFGSFPIYASFGYSGKTYRNMREEVMFFVKLMTGIRDEGDWW